MQAIIFDHVGEPGEVLNVADIPPPHVRAGHALIAVRARPIHPADAAFIRGKYRLRPQFPQVAGLEGVGTVVETGAGVDAARGSRVAFRWPGSWAEFAVVPAERLIEVPPDISDQDACQMSLNPLTAWGLLDRAKVVQGDTIVLTAATSSVSNLAGALARRRGIRVIGIVRGDPSAAATRCTADHLLSDSDAELVASILSATDGKGAAALIDSVGGPIVAKLFGALAPGARLVAYGVQSSEAASVTNAMLIYSNLTWYGFGIDHWLSRLSPDATAAMRAELWSMLRQGTLSLPVASTHPLDAIGDALAAEAQSRRGKVLLV